MSRSRRLGRCIASAGSPIVASAVVLAALIAGGLVAPAPGAADGDGDGAVRSTDGASAHPAVPGAPNVAAPNPSAPSSAPQSAPPPPPPVVINPANADPATGLRILPPTATQLVRGQRFDLRIETQVQTDEPVELASLTVNGDSITAAFEATIARQGRGLESGTPPSPRLYGATARNLSFARAGVYVVEAVIRVGQAEHRVRNVLPVAELPLAGGKTAIRRLVIFLSDGTGLPIWTAARIVGHGIFEGRARGELNLERMRGLGLSHTPSFDSTITDSAPGMASLVSGMKQPNNALNVSLDNTPENDLDNPRVETLFELLKRTRGWRTGVVTDAYATDATPAGVSTHSRSRKQRAAIAQQMLDFYRDGTAQPRTGFGALAELTQPLDVLLGGGAVDWLATTNPEVARFYQYPPGKGRSDVDLLAGEAPALGYRVVKSLPELRAAPLDRPLLGIFTGEFRPASTGLGPDNLPGCLDRLVARGRARIGGLGADAPALGMAQAPPFGDGCGATVQACFAAVPAKIEMVEKAVATLDRLAGPKGSWVLLVEQSQTDKLGHVLELERVSYEALELDAAIGWVLDHVANDGRTLVVVTSDHAQPESSIGVVLPASVGPEGATRPGGCTTPDPRPTAFPLTLGSKPPPTEPCLLQDAVGTFDDAIFPTYADLNGDGFPDDPDPTVKLVLDDAGRPAYTQDYRTNPLPLVPAGASAALPNPARDPEGLLLTGNMPTRAVAGSASRIEGNVAIAPHSADDVVVAASGPGEDLFAGMYENTSIHVRIAAALGGARARADLDRGSDFVGVPAVSPRAGALAGLAR